MQPKSFIPKGTFVSCLIILAPLTSGMSLLSIGEVKAKDLGNYGQVFEISEKNLLDQILEKLQKAESTGVMGSIQKDIQEKMTDRLLASFERDGAPRAGIYRSWTHDPSVTVSTDLRDHKGVVFAKKGDRVNPLDRVSFGESMIFINGEDPNQVAWAQGQDGKIILVKGQPLKLEEALNRPLYFDQQGILRKKFDLKAYPAKVSQQIESDKVLLVEEIDDLRAIAVSIPRSKDEGLVDVNKYEEGESDDLSSSGNDEASHKDVQP